VKVFLSHSVQETFDLGRRIGKAAPGGSVIAYRGGLGAGKTTLSKGIAAGLGVQGEVTSPTYTIVSEYPGRLTLYHIDAYRLGGESDFFETGGFELLGEPGSLCLVEWSERIPDAFDSDAARISIQVQPDGTRRLELLGEWLEALLP
jgi:tRNA threonylcarbamoyladenosine biosynthesis protein TsaE